MSGPMLLFLTRLWSLTIYHRAPNMVVSPDSIAAPEPKKLGKTTTKRGATATSVAAAEGRKAAIYAVKSAE